MVNTDSGSNANPNKNPDVPGASPRDWREQRREWRSQRREARHRYPFQGLCPGLILILLGALVLSTQQGWISGDAWWQYLLIGIGVICIIGGMIRYQVTEYRYCGRGRFVTGITLIAIGVMGFKINITGNLFMFWLVLSFGAICFMSIGFALTGLIKTARSATPTNQMTYFTLMFLGGLFFPNSMLPNFLGHIASALPSIQMSDAL
jgi:hypothetical protein